MKRNYLLSIVVFLCCITTTNAQKVDNFTFKNLDNQFKSYNDLKGQNLTLIDFWTSSCKPCRKAIKELIKIQKDYSDKGLNIIGVNCDGPRSVSRVKPLSKTMKINYPVLLDMNSELLKELNLSAYPSLVLIDNEGEVVWSHEGFVSGDEIEIREKIDYYLSN